MTLGEEELEEQLDACLEAVELDYLLARCTCVHPQIPVPVPIYSTANYLLWQILEKVLLAAYFKQKLFALHQHP